MVVMVSRLSFFQWDEARLIVASVQLYKLNCKSGHQDSWINTSTRASQVDLNLRERDDRLE